MPFRALLHSQSGLVNFSNFMNSNESKTYQDMHDQQLAITMSKPAIEDLTVNQSANVQPAAKESVFL